MGLSRPAAPAALQRRPALAWAFAWALVLALLLAQGLGLWHRVQHGGGAGSRLLLAAAEPAGDHDRHFGHLAAEDAQCQLYDHASGGLGLATAAAATAGAWLAPADPPAALAGAAPGWASSQPYEARAPPRG